MLHQVNIPIYTYVIIFYSEETKYFATSADFAVLYLSVLTRKGHISGTL